MYTCAYSQMDNYITIGLLIHNNWFMSEASFSQSAWSTAPHDRTVASDLWPFPVALRDSCSLLRAASFHFNCTQADCWVILLWYQIWHWASHTVIHAVREIASQLTSFLASWLIAQTGCGRMRMHEWNVLDYITRKKNNNQVKAGDEWSEPPCLLLLWFLRMNCC